MLNPYDELGVEPTASREELKRAYRRRARQLHPDHGPNEAEAMIRLNQAWAMLSEPTGQQDDERPRQTRPWGMPLLPWIILAIVMLAIFVFTAYAGPHAGAR